MATHSIHAWKIPWTEEPGVLQFLRLQRVRHSFATEQQQEALNILSIMNRQILNLQSDGNAINGYSDHLPIVLKIKSSYIK